MNVSSPWLRSYLNGEIDTTLVISTTGSGGKAKEVEIPAKVLLATSKAALKYLNAKSGEVWSLLIPTNHIAGINVLTRAILLGTEVVSVKEHADYTSIVPTQLHNAFNGDDELLKHLQGCKAVLVGGARTPDNLLSLARENGINVITTYGATETCGGCIYDGRPLEGVSMRIVNELVEIQISEMNHGDWIQLNDLGEIEDGRLKILGRKDDVIISGGENISLVRLEKYLERSFPNQKFLALSLPDDKWGDSLALISDSPFPSNMEIEIEKDLGKLYLPKSTKVVPEIPQIGIGKYDRNKASELFFESE